MACPLSLEKVWTDKGKYDEAEKQHFEKLSKLLICNGNNIERDQTPGPVSKSPISNPLPLNKNHKSVKTQSMIQSSEPPSPTPIPAKTDDLLSKSKSKKKKKSKNSNSSVDTNLKIAAENVRNEAIGDLNIVQKIDEFISKCPRSVQSTPVTISQKDFKPKEVKEKRNKADKRKQESSSIDSCKSELCEAQGSSPLQSSLAGEVARARQHIKNSLECMDGIAALVPNTEVLNRLTALEKDNASLQKAVDDLRNLVIGIQSQVKSIATNEAVHASTSPICARPAPAAVAKKVEDDEDDGVDLFGSDSEGEDEAAAKIRDERLAAYAAKKSKKPVLIAKSNIILDVKPWDDETDMKAMEAAVREVKTDGLLWGAAKLVPLAYGIHKLQISCVVEDDKVSIDWLQEELEKIEDYVQSVDIAAFNKV